MEVEIYIKTTNGLEPEDPDYQEMPIKLILPVRRHLNMKRFKDFKIASENLEHVLQRLIDQYLPIG